jgi:hypothetical protein
MTTEVIPRPSRSYRNPRSVLVAVVALIVAALIGAGVVALSGSGTSGERAATVQRAALPPKGNIDACAGDGGALLATVVAMPIEVSSDIASRLSAPTRALLASAVEQSAITRTTPGPPDAAVLSAALSRVAPADAMLVMGGLSPQTRDAIAAQAGGSACR